MSDLPVLSSLKGKLSVPTDEYEYYEGGYDIIPSAQNEIELQTVNKIMLNNVKIGKIPFFKATNPTGGETIYIGSEVD